MQRERSLLVTRAFAALSTVVVSMTFASVAAQSIRLNGPLAQPLAGDVTDYAISTDGQHVVYRGDQAFDEVFELYSAPIGGSATAVRLHAALPNGGKDVSTFALGSGRAVFLGDLGTDEQFELYSAPIDGGDGSAGPLSLSGVLPAAADVLDFALTPDGTRVVLSRGCAHRGDAELFVVRSTAARLP
jgi:hypothetical protein